MSGVSRGRRRVLTALGTLGGTALGGCVSGAPVMSQAEHRPRFTHGIQAGTLTSQGGVLWARADRPARLTVEIDTTPRFARAIRLPPALALPEHDLTARVALPALPRGEQLCYRMRFESVATRGAASPWETGRCATPKRSTDDIRFLWGGDTAGQGYGIDPAHGGMRSYAAMLATEPDFFIHSGDTIYADGPIPADLTLPNGDRWQNLVSDGVDHVAQSLDDFRGRYRYNLRDTHLLAFNAAVPGYYHWDDHEVLNNHSPDTRLAEDERYHGVTLAQLKGRARRAFAEMLPVPPSAGPANPQGLTRRVRYSDQLEVFSLDLRSFRAGNRPLEPAPADGHPLLGRAQFDWLLDGLKRSSARWKVIACSQPIGAVIADDFRTGAGMEGIASGTPGQPQYREAEVHRLLRALRENRVRNLLWLTADVHYAAAHHYDPERAAVDDFDPFWEFVAGPLHAGTFPAAPLDPTFGPRLDFYAGPEPGEGVNLPPSANKQYFGQVDLDGRTGVLTVSLKDRTGQKLYQRELVPQA
ncbi:MAG: alkaline phosphatase D family protein [Pseudomonadota bacterium]